ncbi:MAG: S9 family peptidase [Hyphomicrobiaceae bacterium]|nr:S9 family peptidase [Hyphomicrobiaceae bacterium]MCC0010289.1 S9 family peptidase [Hyphomicrobiaceae bacterium]
MPVNKPVASDDRSITPPKADLRPHSTTWHGITLSDPFAWLRADNWRDVMREPDKLAPDIRAYLEAENAYTAAALAETDALQDELFVEMKGRIKEDDSSVPAPDGPYDYYGRYIVGGQYPLVCRRPRSGSQEQILIDGNAEGADKAYWGFAGSGHAPNHRLISFAVDEKGSEFYTIRIRDMETGKNLPDLIEDAGPGMVWSADSSTLFYVRYDENHRPRAVYRHTLGTPQESDVLVYEEEDTGYYVHISATQSARFVLIITSDHETSEVHVIDAHKPDSAPRLVTPRTFGHEYDVEENGGTFYITTNSKDAEDFRICTTPVEKPALENWRELIAHRPGRLILDTVLYKNHMARLERENGLPRIVIRELATGAEHDIAFDEEAYSLGLSHGYEFDTTTVRFTYSSMTTPSEVYDYDMVTRERVLMKRQEVPTGHDPANYVTRRLYAAAQDGEAVPLSIVYRKTTPLDGTAPVLLYGYGAYGITIPASFSTSRLSLVDRGFIYVIAHIRGGKDKGYHWYTDGKREKKTNTFNDFIAAGEHLVAKGFTRKGQIVAHGGSAGGMLMGAVANMAPDLFGGIIADVPFVDVLTTMLDKDLPLTPPEWKEWGNPIESRDDFERIQSYSPYDNVTAQNYPHILSLAGLTDPRVTYWEPAKWTARLREKNTSANLILLRTNMDAGHGGASGRFEQLKETAIEYAFALKIMGKDEAAQI